MTLDQTHRFKTAAKLEEPLLLDYSSIPSLNLTWFSETQAKIHPKSQPVRVKQEHSSTDGPVHETMLSIIGRLK
jgi:hypothetical protein